MAHFKSTILALAATGFHCVSAIDLDVGSSDSIKSAARQLAYGVQSWYHANETGPESSIGTFPPPAYWWEGGAVWGGMIDYWAYTDDSSWNEVITQGLLGQVNAPAYDYMAMAYSTSLGNDDQAFWALAAMSAVEYGFPVPDGQSSSFWLDVVRNVFDSQTPRWETSTCGGGLRWQIFESNPGWDYKNSISSGSLFQMAARLARFTGNQTYVDWAGKTWDWMTDVGFISPTYQVFDGAAPSSDCKDLNPLQWTYNPAMLIYGTVMLADFTNDQVWRDRTDGLLKYIEDTFVYPYENATNIFFEPACEPTDSCNYDQLSFKAYLSRWLAKAAIVYPSISDTVQKYLSASAQAAATSCTGGDDGKTCGQRWYTGSYDGAFGLGQELSALETVQALLLLNGGAVRIQPLSQQTVQSAPAPSPEPSPTPSSTPSPTPSPTHSSTPTPVISTSIPSTSVAPTTSVTPSSSTPSVSSQTPTSHTVASSTTSTSTYTSPSTTESPTSASSTRPEPSSSTVTSSSSSSSISTERRTVSKTTTNAMTTESRTAQVSSTTAEIASAVETPNTPATPTTETESTSTGGAHRAQATAGTPLNMAAAGVVVVGLALDHLFIL